MKEFNREDFVKLFKANKELICRVVALESNTSTGPSSDAFVTAAALNTTSNVLTLTVPTKPNVTVDLSSLAGGTDTFLSAAALNSTTNVLTLTVTGKPNVTVDLSSLAGDSFINAASLNASTKVITWTNPGKPNVTLDLSPLFPTNGFSSSLAFTQGTALTVTHNLNSTNVIVQVIDSSGKLVIPGIVDTYAANTVNITVSTSGTYKVLISKVI